MSGSIRRKHTFDGDDALRELMSSMLSGRYKEETYLADVTAVCRSRPESAPRLIALIDRYKRLGRMPAAQHAKVRARIDEVIAVVQPARKRGVEPLVKPIALQSPVICANDADPVVNIDHLLDEADEPDDNDDMSEESMTREFLAQPNGVSCEPKPAKPAIAPAPPCAVVSSSSSIRASSDTRVLPSPIEPRAAALQPPLDAAATRVIAAEALSVETRLLPSNPSASAVPPEMHAAANSAATAAAASAVPSPLTALTSDGASSASASAITSIGAGTVLHDRYELRHLLGRGGIATVYRAVDRYRVNLGLEDCYVAVKIVQPHPSRPGSVAALGREFHNAQLLSHPNVINVFNIDHAGDASFYTMELLDGERLSQLVKRVGGVLPRRYAWTILRDIGAAVAHAHSRGVVHADLKPHNIMVTRAGQVRVLDFGSGLIRAREPWISELSPDETYRQATPAYASCEQLEGWSADPRDDIYALSCLAYLLLTGRHPFDLQPSLEARAHKLQPRRPANLRSESWRALKRGLSWTRDQRTMPIEDWLQQLGVNCGAESLPPLSRLHAARPPNRWLNRGASAAVIIAALGLAAFTVEHRGEFDLQPTLVRAQDTLNGAWRGLQSLADSSSTQAGSSTPALPATPPAAAPEVPSPGAVHRSYAAASRNASAGLSHPAHSASAAATAAAIASASAMGAPVRGTGEDSAPTPAAPAATIEPIVRADAESADAAPSPAAPRLAFSAPSYIVPGTEPAARIVIRRSGSTDGDLNFVWWTEEGSARADVDYASLGRRLERIPSGSDKITVFVPIISTPQRNEVTQFYVTLGEPGSSQRSAGPGTRSVVTIDRGS